MQEKNITVSNHEHDTQKLLLRMVEHLRETKVLRAQMDKIQGEKDRGKLHENELLKVFARRQN